MIHQSEYYDAMTVRGPLELDVDWILNSKVQCSEFFHVCFHEIFGVSDGLVSDSVIHYIGTCNVRCTIRSDK